METIERSHSEVKHFATANLHLDQNAEEFRAIDEQVRAYDKQWVAIASMCLRVKQGELWRHGGHHSWEAWIHAAAPKSARTIFYFTGVLKDLAPDFSVEEMAEMRPETAKTLRKVSKAARHDPKVRDAAKGSRRHLVSVLSETHPEELIEQTETMELHFEKSFIGLFQTFLSGIRVIEDSEELSYEAAIELAIIAWFNEPFGDSGLNNLQRLKQLEMLK